MSDTTQNELVSRRGFLLGSLGSTIAFTAAGTTGLILKASPSNAAPSFVADVTGDYSFQDSTTGCIVTVTVANGVRRIRSNGMPNHSTGQFPNSKNPNAISPQSYDFSLPTSPTTNIRVAPYAIPQPFGIAVNGVLFDPLAAEYYDDDRDSGWSYNALDNGIDLGLDDNEAHVQPTGAYHYHGIPRGAGRQRVEERTFTIGRLVGWSVGRGTVSPST